MRKRKRELIKFDAGRTTNNKKVWIHVKQEMRIGKKKYILSATAFLTAKQAREQGEWLIGLADSFDWVKKR